MLKYPDHEHQVDGKRQAKQVSGIKGLDQLVSD